MARHKRRLAELDLSSQPWYNDDTPLSVVKGWLDDNMPKPKQAMSEEKGESKEKEKKEKTDKKEKEKKIAENF